MRILFVEDLSPYSKSLTDFFGESGHNSDIAIDISRAMDFLDTNTYDILIVDMNMRTTGLTGDQKILTKTGLGTGWIWLRDIIYPKYPNLKDRTVILTAYTRDIEEKLTNLYNEIINNKIPFLSKSLSFKTILSETERRHHN